MTTEYTDLKILDCNRLHSIQARSGNDTNKALFTNELGKGIKLKVGDRVSVKGAYISEVGAGSDTVELKGTNTGERRTVEYTLEEGEHKVSLEDSYSNGSEALPLITPYQQYTVSASNLTYDIKDNETYITIQYYLNNAGDSGYLSLPRRFASLLSSEEDNSHYTNLDKLDQGRPYQEVHEGQFVSDDYMYYDNSTDATGSGFYKLRTDCSRYTLMKRDGVLKLRRETILDPSYPEENIDNDFPPDLDYISGSKYHIYKQLIKLGVREGFNSPDSISDEITRQLKEASAPVDFKVKFQDIIRPVSQYYTTETFKPQLCGSNYTMEKEQYDRFTFSRGDASIPEEDRKESAWAYWSNYYNIYHKRPEIREAGQNFNNLWGSNIHNRNDILSDEQSSATIILSLEYNETNLKNISNIFKAQKLYPELFSNENAQKIQPLMKRGVLEARYLHMNTQYSSTRNASLGGDNININASNVNNQSLPLFIEYQPQNEDKDTGGYDRLNLSYGFATRYRDGTKDYIRLFTERIGGMNAGLFKEAEGSASNVDINSGTLIGYDYSYNAYGTACLMGYSGRLRYDYATINEWGTGDKNLWKQEDHSGRAASSLGTARYMRYNYVGCNNPLFKYDPENTRFYFSQLHTPELNGQGWISAGDNGSNVSPQIEDNTQNGGGIVYKINKRINPYTYTPDMKPYEFDMTVSYPYGHEASSNIDREISKPNRSIYPWAIFDSQSGIFISDFGYDENNWDNGLWGILGFTYNQFNKTQSSDNNRLSRIINTNINDLNIPTTNADIVSSDTRNFIVNQFGAVYFTTQLPSSSTLTDRDFLPAITNNAVSIKLLAQNLPRKMLRPYYCIRSDIIDSPHYIGGDNSNNDLPVVAICDKQYSGGDFYFGAEGDFIFTITKEKTITNITTSIHDPDQSFSQVNSDSAVIYKIESNVVNDISIAEELMEGLKKKK
jgi:hypothetical protein